MHFSRHFFNAKKSVLVLFVFVNCFLSAQMFSIPPHSPQWERDVDCALALSVKEHKPLLLVFVGSSWCPWSQKLCEEVLFDPAFIDPLKEKLVLVVVDLLESGNGNSLKQRYSITECPTLLLLTPDGEEMTRVGFLALQPKEYSSHLEKLGSDFQEISVAIDQNALPDLKVQSLEVLYTKAKTLGCKKFVETLLHEGMKREDGGFFLLEQYEALLATHRFKHLSVQELRAKIIKSDPNNSQGRLLRLALIDFKSLAARPKKNHHPAEAAGPLIEYVRKFGKKDSENLWKVEMMIAQYLFSKDLTGLALENAQASYEHAPESVKPEIASAIDYLKQHNVYPLRGQALPARDSHREGEGE